jgi:hypothetical protein
MTKASPHRHDDVNYSRHLKISLKPINRIKFYVFLNRPIRTKNGKPNPDKNTVR